LPRRYSTSCKINTLTKCTYLFKICYRMLSIKSNPISASVASLSQFCVYTMRVLYSVKSLRIVT
jgi:hypothetical protein